MNISNKTIVLLLVAAILISATGTLVSLNKLKSISPTGYVAAYGYTNLSIESANSINISSGYEVVDFGICTPPVSGWVNQSSNATGQTNCARAGNGAVDFIRVVNDGNIDVNVTIQADRTASTFIGGTLPNFYYDTNNSNNDPGCITADAAAAENGGICNDQGNCTTTDWTQFTTAATEYKACENLSYVAGANEFDTYILVQIPSDAPFSNENNATLTFTSTIHS